MVYYEETVQDLKCTCVTTININKYLKKYELKAKNLIIRWKIIKFKNV